VDGGLKTGRDVMMAALLGADEYSFGTAALLAQGCIMVRTCHLDTCPVGIATQRPELRAKFAGTPEMVMNYMLHIAEEVRHILASLGLRSLDQAIGRTELLRQRSGGARVGRVDLSPLLRTPQGERRFRGPVELQSQRSGLGDRVYEDAWPAFVGGRSIERKYEIHNSDRTVGARLAGAIAHRFGASRAPGTALVHFTGEAGQSFGAFLTDGLDFRLRGEANDYVGKGMSGGRIVIVPPSDDAGDPRLIGNTILYGATGGELFVAGLAGERFAVRNSGASAVIEGAGDHCCEYMTAGVVAVLGPVGLNFGAGMTGGEAFVYDPSSGLPALVNPDLVDAHRVVEDHVHHLRALIERHVELTGSERGRTILAGWEHDRHLFWRIAPKGDVETITKQHEGTLQGAKTASA
jgi:glutamate synthase domain-containing protein 3